MKIITIALLVTFAFDARSADKQSLPSNPCLNWDLEGIETPHESIDVCHVSSAKRLLASADIKQHLMQGNVELAVRNWLTSSSTLFANLRPEDIGVRSFKNAGNNQLAMFEVYLVSKPESLYFVKFTWTNRDNGQLKLLRKVQNSILAHSACWTPCAATPLVAPRLPWIYDAAVVPWIHDARFPEPGDPDLLIVLMEKLPGITLAKNNGGVDFLADRVAGQSLGYFHALFAKNPEAPFEGWQTFRHSDLHAHNLLVDSDTKSVGLIDGYFSLGHVKDELETYASSQIGVFFDRNMSLLFDKGCPTFFGVIKDLVIENHCKYDEVTSCLENPTIQNKIKQSQTFQAADRTFKHFRAFALGYMEAMPIAKRAEIKAFFRGLCLKMFRSLVDLVRKESSYTGSIDQLENAILKVIPPQFLESIEHTDV